MQKVNFPERHLLPDEVYVKLDVFGPLVTHRVPAHVDGRDVVAEDDCGGIQWTTKLTEKRVQPGALYSASELDLDSVVCNLEDHETRVSPRKMQKPEVDRCVWATGLVSVRVRRECR
jgi:hypothetical protein